VTDQTVGLIMSGGGARAAYQVGVLRAIASMLPQRSRNPFKIICGTSAGAINAASLASNVDRFDHAVSRLARTWGNLHVGQVYRADLLGAARMLSRCLAAFLAGGLRRPQPVSLLDCTPLAGLLGRLIDFPRIRHTIDAGHLSAVCITASSYTSGDSISFFQGNDSHQPWRRARRVGRPAEIGLAHVLASCALSFAFPVVRIDGEHFGDGSMHQLAPISAALHLGAQRVLVIGVGSASPHEREARDPNAWPSLAQIAGYMLDAIFVDTLDMDLERLQRVNRTLASIPKEVRSQPGTGLRTVETLVIRPSKPVDKIAAAHAAELPRLMRLLMRRIGVLEPDGARVLSYLLFERGYCRHLMDLGVSDAMAQRACILNFLDCDSAFGKRSEGRHSQQRAAKRQQDPGLVVQPLVFARAPVVGVENMLHRQRLDSDPSGVQPVFKNSVKHEAGHDGDAVIQPTRWRCEDRPLRTPPVGDAINNRPHKESTE
jgi:NTE family protein